MGIWCVSSLLLFCCYEKNTLTKNNLEDGQVYSASTSLLLSITGWKARQELQQLAMSHRSQGDCLIKTVSIRLAYGHVCEGLS